MLRRQLQRGTSQMKRGGMLRQRRLTRVDSEARIKADLTTLTSLIVRMRDGYCVLCGSSYQLQAGHFWHRSMPPTEYDLTNVFALCARDNQRHEYFPQEFTAWVKAKLGDEAFEALSVKAHSQTKLTYIELWEMRERYRAMFTEAKRLAA